MLKFTKSFIALLLAAVLLISASLPIFAAGQPSSYSSSRNSGERDVVCTTLEGTGAEDYYTGSYDYDALMQLSSSALLTELRELMTETHKKQTSYSDCRDYSDETDCENGNTTIITLYTSHVSSQSEYNGGSGWNREHVWPKSLGGFETSGAGADLHHIRPSESKTNSTRGNLKYGNVSNGNQATGNLSGDVGGTYSSGYFEPLDNVKGDVARICLYVYVRWGAQYSKCSSITNVFQSIDVLLEWCELDPVDTWEMGRNEVVESIQGNRNVFIDYPELAWALFGKVAPSNMTTPSGGKSDGVIGGGDTPVDPPVDPPVTPPVDTETTVTSVINGTVGTSYTVEGTVVAINAQSFLLADNTGSILVYKGKSWSPDVKVGDTVKVSGETSVYANAVQFGTTATYSKIGTASVSHPIPKSVDGKAADAYLSKTTVDVEYIRINGTLSVSGNYYNLAIEGATIIGSLTYPQSSSSLAALDGKEVTVIGYVTGVVNTRYLNIMFTSVAEATSGECSHENTSLVGKKDATGVDQGYSGDVYCNDCGETVTKGTSTPATGVHSYKDVTSGGTTSKVCTVCGHTEAGTEVTPEVEDVYKLLDEVESDAEIIIILINLGATDRELLEAIFTEADK